MNILRRRYVETGLGASIGVKGEFKLWTETESGIRREPPEFNNMILAGGMARLQTSNTPERMSVGTGTALEDYNQTSLQSELYSTEDRQVNVWGYGSAPDYNAFARVVYRIAPQGSAYTITEVGFGPADDLFSRALIRDSNGELTSISVLAGEFLYIQYTLRVFHNQAPVTGIFNIRGTDHTYTMVPCGVADTTATMANLFPLIYPNRTISDRQIVLSSSSDLPATPLDRVVGSGSGTLPASGENRFLSRSGHSVSWGGSSVPGTAFTARMLAAKLYGGTTINEMQIAVSFDPPIVMDALDSFHSEWEASYVAL